MDELGTGNCFNVTNPDEWENAAEDFSPPVQDASLDEEYELEVGGKDDAFDTSYD